LDYQILGTETAAYLEAAGILVLTLGGLKLFQLFILFSINKIFKNRTAWRQAFVRAVSQIGWLFFVAISIQVMIQFVELPAVFERYFYYLFLLILIYYASAFVSKLFDYATRRMVRKRGGLSDEVGMLEIVKFLVIGFLWAVFGIWVLSNLGYNVTTLIASLGVGGIVVALALQSVLGDLFSSLNIYFDKPFKVGDLVVIDGKYGWIKAVGFQTTRVTALQGEEMIYSNSDITRARVQNFGRLQRRRIVFSVGVVYETPVAKLKLIPGIIAKIMEAHDNLTLEWARFMEFGNFSLNYEIAYYVESPSYLEYTRLQHEVNLAIMEEFQKENITIAYPTQLIYWKKGDNPTPAARIKKTLKKGPPR